MLLPEMHKEEPGGSKWSKLMKQLKVEDIEEEEGEDEENEQKLKEDESKNQSTYSGVSGKTVYYIILEC